MAEQLRGAAAPPGLKRLLDRAIGLTTDAVGGLSTISASTLPPGDDRRVRIAAARTLIDAGLSELCHIRDGEDSTGG
jgi:hypothetical protein